MLKISGDTHSYFLKYLPKKFQKLGVRPRLENLFLHVEAPEKPYLSEFLMSLPHIRLRRRLSTYLLLVVRTS